LQQKRKHNEALSKEETNEQSEEISNEKVDNDTAYDEESSDELDDLLLKPADIFAEERTDSPKV